MSSSPWDGDERPVTPPDPAALRAALVELARAHGCPLILEVTPRGHVTLRRLDGTASTRAPLPLDAPPEETPC